jgi:O-antigen/teichoic acid export membrane protein
MPRHAIVGIGRKVIIPSISILAADLPSEQLRPKILKNRNLILIPLAIGLAIFVSYGDQLTLIMYGDGEYFVKYSWMIPILALGIWHRTLHNLMGSCLLAVGKSQYPAMGNILTLVNLCIGIPLGYHLKGNLGALIAIAVSDIPTYVVITYGLWREKLSCFWQDIQLTVLFVGVLAAIILCRYALGGGLPLDYLSAADMIPINSLFP